MQKDELFYINKRIDDMKDEYNQRLDDFKGEIKDDLKELKDLVIRQTNVCTGTKTKFNDRVTKLEHFKTKLLTLGTGMGLILGIVVGRGI